MRVISLKPPEYLLETSRHCASTLRLSRAAYIRCAIERMNHQTLAQLRAKRLTEASKTVRKESLRINREFAAIDECLS